jgi:hypothetical protein
MPPADDAAAAEPLVPGRRLAVERHLVRRVGRDLVPADRFDDDAAAVVDVAGSYPDTEKFSPRELNIVWQLLGRVGGMQRQRHGRRMDADDAAPLLASA